MKLKCVLFLCFPLILVACSNNVSKELASEKSKRSYKIHTSSPPKGAPANNKGPNEKEFDPREFPAPVIHTIEELDTWIERNGNVVVSYFRPGSSNPYLAMDEELIQYLVDRINSSKRLTYGLFGHTNNQGNKESNMKLSTKRAMATMEIMLNKYGLELSKNGAFGEGESNPSNSNDTKEGRQRNSRVELRKLK